MQHFIIRLVIFSLTFIIGLAAQTVWIKSGDIIDRCGEFILRGQD